jgi:hypothetical protein
VPQAGRRQSVGYSAWTGCGMQRVPEQDAVNIFGSQTLKGKATVWLYRTRQLEDFASQDDYFDRLHDFFSYRDEEDWANQR